MRLLLAVHNVYTEYASGAARSMRTIMTWLHAAGHECRVLSTARFESTRGAVLHPHLAELGITPQWREGRGPRGIGRYLRDGVDVTLLATRHHDLAAPDRAEGDQYLHAFDGILRDFRPDIVLSYGAHPVLHEALGWARASGARTVFSVRKHGYDAPQWYRNADHVLATSAYMAREIAEKAGVAAAALPSPINWAEVTGTEETRGFLTFVNPTLAKGVALFARLADMLGQLRADIPILIVQSTGEAAPLTRIPGVELARYPQIMVSPPMARTADIFSLTRVLLVPSVFAEPFGRVAAEAMINGVPALVSDRGGLPETVAEGGLVRRGDAALGRRGGV